MKINLSYDTSDSVLKIVSDCSNSKEKEQTRVFAETIDALFAVLTGNSDGRKEAILIKLLCAAHIHNKNVTRLETFTSEQVELSFAATVPSNEHGTMAIVTIGVAKDETRAGDAVRAVAALLTALLCPDNQSASAVESISVVMQALEQRALRGIANTFARSATEQQNNTDATPEVPCTPITEEDEHRFGEIMKLFYGGSK